MAKQTIKVPRKSQTSEKHKLQRERFRQVVKLQQRDSEGIRAEYSQQVAYDDVFSELYSVGSPGVRILEPTYKPGRLYWVHENSAFLPACTDAMIQNVHGFGYRIVPVEGMMSDLQDDPVAQAEAERVKEMMENPNDRESGKSLRKNLGQDYEVTGNMYMEVVRDGSGAPALLFWADSRRVRACAVDVEPLPIVVEVERRGKMVKYTAMRYFRRYVMSAYQTSDEADAANLSTVRYYKEYGDPRIMNALTGEFLSEIDIARYKREDKEWQPATEIWHHKHGTGVYGVPRWIGNTFNVIGLTRADFVNWDLFDSQGIPPLIITVSGGRLTDESLEDLTDMIESLKGVKQFNKTLLLETEAISGGGLNDSTPQVRVDVKSMIDYRQDDAMFTDYSEKGRKSIRESFRLPSVFVGNSDGYNYATAVISRTTAEEQVFVPERESFDDRFNRTILRDMGITKVKMQSLGPAVAADEFAARTFPYLIQHGAFTLNELITYTNKVLGTDIQLYEDEEWANVPTPVLLSIAPQLGAEEVLNEEMPTTAPPQNGGENGEDDSEEAEPENGEAEAEMEQQDQQKRAIQLIRALHKKAVSV